MMKWYDIGSGLGVKGSGERLNCLGARECYGSHRILSCKQIFDASPLLWGTKGPEGIKCPLP